MSGHVYFIGAGPGAPDLITLRGRDLIARADLVIYADSLVHPGVAAYAKPGAEVVGSKSLTLEQTMDRILAAVADGKLVARVQSGDPSVYGAIHEQMGVLEQHGVPYTIVPGVSSAFAAAAVLQAELTVPDVAQTVIFTRMSGRTAVPERERLRELAAHQTSLVIFLSIPLIEQVAAELQAGGYAPETPAAVVYRATWKDELVLRGTLADIAGKAKAAGLQLQALILVGKALDPVARGSDAQHRSNLYDPVYTQRHRRGTRPGP
ncbi:MAG: precorrin-4 C(11)-methyltransferase, partial [Dehalococcoidia bacterium]